MSCEPGEYLCEELFGINMTGTLPPYTNIPEIDSVIHQIIDITYKFLFTGFY